MVKTFKEILQESMSEEQALECFPVDFDPTKNGDEWYFSGNPDDYHSALWDYILHHWCPHHAFDELNKGNEKIADAVSSAWKAGWTHGIKAGRKESTHKD